MVIPNSDCVLFCQWIEDSGYYRLSTQRMALVAIIKSAAISGAEVTNSQYNDFIRFTSLLYPAYVAFTQLSSENYNIIPMPRKIIAYQNIDSDHTGDLNETILCSLLIPAGAVDVNDKIVIESFLRKVNDNGACDWKYYFGPSDNSLVGATNTALWTMGATANSGVMKRQLAMKGGTGSNVGYPYNFSAINDSTSSTYNATTLDIDFSTDQYFMITAQLANAADTARLSDVQVYIDKP